MASVRRRRRHGLNRTRRARGRLPADRDALEERIDVGGAIAASARLPKRGFVGQRGQGLSPIGRDREALDEGVDVVGVVAAPAGLPELHAADLVSGHRADGTHRSGEPWGGQPLRSGP